MKLLELQVINGDQTSMQFSMTPGSYRILRRSTENFDIKSTVVSSNIDEWRLNQEDFEIAQSNLSERSEADGKAMVSIEAYRRDDDIPVWDQRMSQPHAILLFDETGANIVDMGSRNGTFLNGERVGAAGIADGDLIRCGTTRILIRTT